MSKQLGLGYFIILSIIWYLLFSFILSSFNLLYWHIIGKIMFVLINIQLAGIIIKDIK